MISLEYLSEDGLSHRCASSPESILGVIAFSTPLATPPDVPAAEVALECLGKNPCEVWFARGAVSRARDGAIAFSTDGSIVFGVLQWPRSDSIANDARGAYGEVLAFFSMRGLRPVRMWNYFPRINEIEDIERYRSFCLGRHEAFAQASYGMTGDLPAGSAIGTTAGDLIVYFIATSGTPLYVENPRQISAFCYPTTYGPKSPSFARGALLSADGERKLFISGTASIVGHESVHEGDVVAQTEETMRNLEVVLANGLGVRSFADADSTQLKVYVRLPSDRSVIEPIVRRSAPRANVLFVQGDVCRRELLVEIEAVVTA